MASSPSSTTMNLNGMLNRYADEKLKMSKQETKKAVDAVVPIVQNIVREIHKLDSRFKDQPCHVGSYYQGLKVDRADEFDMNIPLTGFGEFLWSDLQTLPTRHYGFNDCPVTDDPCRTFPENRQVVACSSELAAPPDGYHFVSLRRRGLVKTESLKDSDLLIEGDIIPYLVKKKLKDLLSKALTTLDLRETVRTSKISRGPALTIKIREPPGLSHAIDVDFAVVIDAGLTVPSRINWPRKLAKWPSTEKVEKIQKAGINLVVKRNFYWMHSFGKMESELVNEIDKDKGCRKQVHKTTKMMLREIWCRTTNPVISSYHLKNVWFWECEDNPLSSSWQKEQLTERFLGVVKRLRTFIRERCLKQYFNPRVNLFQDKDLQALDLVGRNIDKFLADPTKFVK